MSDMLGPKLDMLRRGSQGPMRRVWELKENPFIKRAGFG